MNFDDTKIAFSLKSNNELKSANLLFTLIGNKKLTVLAKPVTNFLLAIKFPIVSILKRTVFKQFCGGETILECNTVIENMYNKNNVHSILDYSVEGKENETQFNATLNMTLKALNFVKASKAIPFLVFKGTGLGRFCLFEKVSKKEALNSKEKEEWQRVISRFNIICEHCSQTPNVRVMIDAEESWIQDAVDNLAKDMMIEYNTKRAVVYNTVQLYRTDRLMYLETLKEEAAINNFYAGVKLVRGAYMEKERNRAEKLGYESPICKDKQTTDDNFDKGLRYILNNIDVCEVFLGTHNEVSTKLLTELMREEGISNANNSVWFGQLYGMGDHISFNLSDNGYNTAKYLPFGPVKEVIPYLFRRAEENTSVDEQTSRELQLIKKEIARRNKVKVNNV